MGNRREFLKQIAGVTALAAAPEALLVSPVAADNEAPATVDFRTPVSRFKALQGVNKGPLAAGGLVDVIAAHRELGVPLTRTHDCHWPIPDVIDMHVVFPDPNADPSRPESYDFGMTDEYIAAIRETGSEVLYRLGETIEHTKIKRFVNPPKDPVRWAEAAKGIIRHYNEGWAGGFQYGIRRWEIWNEPDTRPSQWTGTDEQFYAFYTVVSRSIKAAFPNLMIGGPGIAITGELVGEQLKPSPLMTGFLTTCQREKLPLDFFSWHCYSAHNNPGELSTRAHHIRRLLNEYGFERAESYLDEWRSVPDWDWGPIARSANAKVRQRWYERMVGPEAAAYNAAVLIGLQDAPVDGASFFHGELGGWGLFDESGVPYKNYYGMLAFRRLLDTPERAKVSGALPGGLVVGAGVGQDGRIANVLVSRYAPSPNPIRLKLEGLPWANAAIKSVRLVDAQHDLSPVTGCAQLGEWNLLSLKLPTPSVALITLGPEA